MGESIMTGRTAAEEKYEEIVTSSGAPVLVMAGPGAGKTYLLADRVTRLLKSGVDRQNIVVLTFGKDASEHMRSELVDSKGDFCLATDQLPHISTINSLGYEIVQKKPRAFKLRKIGLQVQPDDEVKRLLYRDAALSIGADEQVAKDATHCKQIGDCTRNGENRTCQVCDKYREIMGRCNRIDFDDQVLFACAILEGDTSLLAEYQKRAKHLLVDEYQDINAAQFRLIELLSRGHRHGLFAVGDDAQSIYGFRGGDPQFILRFEHDYPGAIIETLPFSRRCPKSIMDDAFRVLGAHYGRWKGKPKLDYLRPDCEIPCIWQMPSEKAEASRVAQIAKQSIPHKTVLILAPKVEFFDLISKALTRFRVPHECPLSLLPERLRMVKRFIDWVRAPEDSFLTRVAVEILVNRGTAKVTGAAKNGRCTAETIRKRVAEETTIAKLWNHVDRKKHLFSVIQDVDTSSRSLKRVRDTLVSLHRYYCDYKRKNKGEFARLLAENIDLWSNPGEFAADIDKVVDILTTPGVGGPGVVELKTMRKAKGLQAHVVIIVGLENDIIPNPRSSDMEEEARLLYVSMTRAKEQLFMFHSFRRPRNITFGEEITHKPRSMFLDALNRPSQYMPNPPD
jgi:DNA helicase-2/ATP-dependent DNA helicase PcrA